MVPWAKAIEWGIAVSYQGQEYGPVNRYLMLAGCLDELSCWRFRAVTMWWKRRPRGSFGIPTRHRQQAGREGVLAVSGNPGMLYPLVGYPSWPF